MHGHTWVATALTRQKAGPMKVAQQVEHSIAALLAATSTQMACTSRAVRKRTCLDRASSSILATGPKILSAAAQESACKMHIISKTITQLDEA